MSLYGRYISEREGMNILENDKGFITYYFTEHGVYVRDLYVESDHRHDGEASRLADQVAEIAKEKGHKTMYGSICPAANCATEGLKVLLAYGFRLDSSGPNLIVLKKDI